MERHYALPKDAQPGILVYPHKTAKGGKFECKTMTLNALLDYRQDDNKEHSFEVCCTFACVSLKCKDDDLQVAMFAEAFNEMITRNCAFGVYKALLAAVDKETEVFFFINDFDGRIFKLFLTVYLILSYMKYLHCLE